MAKRNKNFPIQVIIIIGFAMVFYMLFLISTSIYKDYKNESYLRLIEEDSYRILQDNLSKESDYRYFLSEQFKDKYAKERLGKVNPGEEVIVFAKPAEDIFFTQPSDTRKMKNILTLPKTSQWYEYFFGDEQYDFGGV